MLPVILVSAALTAFMLYFWWDPSPAQPTSGPSPVSNEVNRDTVPASPSVASDLNTLLATSSDTALTSVSPDSVGAIAEPERRPLVTRAVRIQLLNGTTEKGLARRVSPRLRALGFDVREVGNAGARDVERTELVDRSGADSLGLILADSLRIPRAAVTYELNTALVDIDVTLILGRDFRTFETTTGR